jgi:integrase
MSIEQHSKKHRGCRGGGSLFEKSKGCGRWHIQYYRFNFEKGRSERVREHCGLPKQDARRLLNDRLARIGRGEQLASKPVTLTELYSVLLKHYQLKYSDKPRSIAGLTWRWKRLAPFFSHIRASNMTTTLVEQYQHMRHSEGAAKATINHEVGTLRRMYRYGKREHHPPLVHVEPHFPMFKLSNARQGFIEPPQFARLCDEAAKDGLWMRLLLGLSYTYGWRRGELLPLRVKRVDLATCILRLDPGTTKNDVGREVPLTDPHIIALVKAACEGKKPDDHVFTRDDCSPVKCIRTTWQNLCIRAGLGSYLCRECASAWTGKQCVECGSNKRQYRGLILHDMRRSAARELRKAGVHENVIMDIGGWKTRSMFDRYAIVNNDDKRRAMDALVRSRTDLAPVSPQNGQTSPLS